MTNRSVIIVIDVLDPFIDDFTLLMIFTFCIPEIIIIAIRTNAKFTAQPS